MLSWITNQAPSATKVLLRFGTSSVNKSMAMTLTDPKSNLVCTVDA